MTMQGVELKNHVLSFRMMKVNPLKDAFYLNIVE